MQSAFGTQGMEALLDARSRQQIESYGARIEPSAPLAARLASLVELRSAEGYMAALEARDDGSYLLVENHCPICTAAAVCSGLCRAELAVFRAVLGEGVVVERRDHILAGARRCAYHVTAE
jgi:predicted ArsR family transcriptional regulator